MRNSYYALMIAVLISAVCAPLLADEVNPGQTQEEQIEAEVTALLELMHVPGINGQQMLALERRLTSINHAAALRPVFRYLARVEVPYMPGGTGDAEWDAQAFDGGPTQLFYGRNRIWRHLGQHAEPEAERKRIVAELFDESVTAREFEMLFQITIWNPSESLEEKLWSLFADREQDAAIRFSSMNALVSVAPRQYTRQIIELAWQERDSEVAINVASRLGGPYYRDPKVSGRVPRFVEKLRCGLR